MKWLGSKRKSASRQAGFAAAKLAARMDRPQRHRLLQGYPMAPAMAEVAGGEYPITAAMVASTASRPLLVGVLPHASCNPSVEGCGFCTFPHEKFNKSGVYSTIAAVGTEIEHIVALHPELAERHVEAVYIGGGTANLAPADALAPMHAALLSHFDLSGAEYTLEGAPVFFTTQDAQHLRALAELEVRQPRISMGVQTFDLDRLKKMGREHIGHPDQVAQVVARSDELGLTHSIDLLFNLPHQSLAEMVTDIERAAELGLDQICLYNLVLYEGVGTPWSLDAELLHGMPDVARACERWLALRDRMFELGYRPSTLTNFERADVQSSARRFQYEVCSFAPQTYDAIGFGPHAISTFSPNQKTGIKIMNAEGSAPYRAAVVETGHGAARHFMYNSTDMRLLHLTRQLAVGELCRHSYRLRFGTDVAEDFGNELMACVQADLLRMDDEQLRLTPRGVFYADSVTGLLAHQRIRSLFPERLDRNASVNHHMG